MTQAVIRKTFLEAIAAYAASHTPALLVARENVAFVKPTNGATFLEVWIKPANTVTPNVSGDRRRFRGNCYINIWTKEGSGAGAAETIAEELYQLFPVYPKNYLPVSIESPVNTTQAIPDGTGWLVTPAIIEYRLEAPN